jgi:ATP-dependent Clp protease ATP-binding subunit ClpX
LGEIFEQVEPEDLIKYGLIPEFVGRMPVVSTLNELNKEALIKILTTPKNALVKQYQKLFEMEETELEFLPESLETIAELAMKRKTGARGLRTIMEETLLDTMYEIPSHDEKKLKKVIVNQQFVLNKSKPFLVISNDSAAPEKKSSVKATKPKLTGTK